MLLERILHSLSEDELHKVRNELRLPGRSQQIFKRLATASTPVCTDDLCTTYGLSKNNLYRLCSEIADACIRLLAPNHQFPKLEFFRSRFLYEPFVTELKRMERQINKNREENLESFYNYGFQSFFGFPISLMDFDLIESYAGKLLHLKIDPPTDYDLQLAIQIIFFRIGSLPRNKKMTVKKMDEISKTLLATISQKCEGSINPMVKYYFYQAQWKANTYSNIRKPERLISLERSLIVICENESLFPEKAIHRTTLQLAFERAALGIGVENAYKQFNNSDLGSMPNTSGNGLFLIRFVKISLMAKQFATARRLLDRVFTYSAIKTAGLYQPFLLLRAMLNIAEGYLEKVENDLTIVRAMNTDEHFFLPHEMEVRALETLSAFKRSDLEIADLLVTRNLKWMQKRRYALEQSPWPYFYQTIRACIAFKQTGERPRPALRQHFEEFRTLAASHAVLLEEEVKVLFLSED